MMDDKELLELAAKSVGAKSDAYIDSTWPGLYIDSDGALYEVTQDGWTYWNPLEDDGAALRLAAKLSLSVQISPLVVRVWWGHLRQVILDATSGDRLKTTRIAIVRAAAEIGREGE